MLKVKNYYILQLILWVCIMAPFTLSFWISGSFSNPKSGSILQQRFLVIYVLGYLGVLLIFTILQYFKVFDKKAPVQLKDILITTLIISLLSGIIESVCSFTFGIFTPRELKMINEKGMRAIAQNVTLNSLSFFSHYILWGFIYFAYLYIRNAQSQIVQTLKLNNLIKELELKTIKSRVNPHFLFNALNGIRSMVEENPSRARNAKTELSNILRSSINIEKYDTIPLEEELRIVKDYIGLEKMRFEDRLQVTLSIDDNLLDCSVPPMIIQTLVENAIKHGISKLVTGGEVNVQVFIEDKNMIIQVVNSGKLMEANTNKGFGLESISNRLHYMYQDAASFSIIQLNETLVCAKVVIPIEESSKFN